MAESPSRATFLRTQWAAEQTKREVERTWEDRRVKGVGSATGEWAFTAEPNIDPDIAHLAMTKFKTSLEKLRTLKPVRVRPRIRPDGTGRSPDGHRPGHECSQADHRSRSARATTLDHVRENRGALDVRLTPEDVAELDRPIPWQIPRPSELR